MPRVPKVTTQSIEDMVEMVREIRSLYDPTCADHMDATVSNNIWHSIPRCPITCSMFPGLFSETLCNTRRPTYSHRYHSGVGSVHTDVQALYTRSGLWVVFRMPSQIHGMDTHFTDADTDMDMYERRHSFSKTRIGTMNILHEKSHWYTEDINSKGRWHTKLCLVQSATT